jgi:hypothetical protein
MPSRPTETHPIIGTLNEKPLHAALKTLLAKPSDNLEVEVKGYVVDILRDDLIIEIQTGSFSKIRKKLINLLDQHSVRLVYPIPRKKWIVKVEGDGETRISRRKSPKRGAVEDIFTELVSFPYLIKETNFCIEVLLTQEEEFRKHEPNRAWRRKGWVTQERRLLEVVDRHLLCNPLDFAALLPESIQDEFTSTDLAHATNQRRRLAGQMAYCLREMEVIKVVGKRGRAYLYSRTTSL